MLGEVQPEGLLLPGQPLWGGGRSDRGQTHRHGLGAATGVTKIEEAALARAHGFLVTLAGSQTLVHRRKKLSALAKFVHRAALDQRFNDALVHGSQVDPAAKVLEREERPV